VPRGSVAEEAPPLDGSCGIELSDEDEGEGEGEGEAPVAPPAAPASVYPLDDEAESEGEVH